MLGACELLQAFPSLPVRDSVHAATMRNNRIVRLVSADTHFDDVPHVTRVEAAAALDR